MRASVLPGSEVAEGGRCRRIQAGHLEPILGREHLGSLAGEVATVTCQPVLDEARVLQLRSAKCRCECVVLHQVPTSSKCAGGGVMLLMYIAICLLSSSDHIQRGAVSSKAKDESTFAG